MDVDDLKQLVAEPGPWVTLELPTPSAIEDAADRLEVEWKGAEDDLSALGVDRQLVERIGAAVREIGHAGGECLVVHATPHGRLRARSLPVELAHRRTTFAPLPRLSTELDWRRRRVPHAVVVVDRTGADVVIDDGSTTETEVVEGTDFPIHKPKAGGWSQQRFQRRAEDSWERHARQVADALAARAEIPEVVVVAGGPRMVSELIDALPDGLADRVVEIDGGRAEGVDVDAMADDIQRALDDHAARRLADLLSRARRSDPDGLAEVLATLSQGLADALVVHDDPDDERTAWFLPDGPVGALGAHELVGLGQEPVEDRLVDVAIRSGLLIGAEVVIGPPSRATGGLAVTTRN